MYKRQDIYNEPQNAFVADFIGESNILDGVMLADYKVNFSGHTFDCVDAGFEKRENVDVVIRPEDVDIVSEEKGMLKGVHAVKGVTGEIEMCIRDRSSDCRCRSRTHRSSRA